MNRKVIIIFSAVAVLAAALEVEQLVSEDTSFTSSISNVIFQSNLHPVVEGRFYRAAEMSSDRLEETVRDRGIKTVIDLRLGREDSEALTSAEAERVEQLGAHYIHFPLRGSRVPDRARVRELVELLDAVQTPVLVHCTSGTHRSGLVSAIWLLAEEGRTLEEAEHQLSPLFGFFRSERALKSLIQGHPTLDNLLWIYDAKARASNVTFRQWIGLPERQHP